MKIVFFIQTQHPLTEQQLVFLDIAAYMSDNTEHEIFFVNNYHAIDTERHIDSSIQYIYPNELKDNYFKDAVYFTAVNYLCNLIFLIREHFEAKICLLSYSEDAFKWLATALGRATKECEEGLFKMINESNATVYQDYDCILPKNKFLNYNNEKFLPLSLTKEINKTYKTQPLISKDEINIAIWGESGEYYTSFSNLISNFRIQNLEKNINIHFIGPVQEWLPSTEMNSASSGVVRLIYVGDFKDDSQVKKYILEKADIVFASGRKAIIAAEFGVPVIIPTTSKHDVLGNNYVWLFDINQYIYSWDTRKLHKLNNKLNTLQSIIEEIYIKNRKEELAIKCFEYVKKNASIEQSAESLLKLTERTILTVEECLNKECIKACIHNADAFLKEIEGDFNFFLANKDGKSISAFNTCNLYRHKIQGNKNTLKYLNVQEKYILTIKKLGRKKKIKVAFIVLFKTTFPTAQVFESMLENSLYDPYIIVVPNVFQTEEYKKTLYKETLEGLQKIYGDRVVGAYDMQNDIYKAIAGTYDIVFFNNPYKALVHPNHHIDAFINKQCLCIYANYGFAVVNYWKEVINTDFSNYLWKFCIENNENLDYFNNAQAIKGMNGLVTGYFKMDQLAKEKGSIKDRKMILICPHHTVTGWEKLDISNFLKYSKFFLDLPIMFPEIDFVFRPHPLLMTNLVKHKIWTEQEVQEYINMIKALPNIEYDDSGYYLDKFANSAAMIHDCASFIAEYLFTKKPCCYMMKTKEKTYEGLIPFGKSCMNQYYQAFNEEDIINFIKDVVINGQDSLKEKREVFVSRRMLINYPNSAQRLIDYITKTIKPFIKTQNNFFDKTP